MSYPREYSLIVYDFQSSIFCKYSSFSKDRERKILQRTSEGWQNQNLGCSEGGKKKGGEKEKDIHVLLVTDSYMDCIRFFFFFFFFFSGKRKLLAHLLYATSLLHRKTISPWHPSTSECHRQLAVCILCCLKIIMQRLRWRSPLFSSVQGDSFTIIKMFFLHLQ